MNRIIAIPVDPRLTPLVALRRLMELPGNDAEEREERKLLHRHDIKDALK